MVMAEVEDVDEAKGFELKDDDDSGRSTARLLLPRSFFFVFFDLGAAGMIFYYEDIN